MFYSPSPVGVSAWGMMLMEQRAAAAEWTIFKFSLGLWDQVLFWIYDLKDIRKTSKPSYKQLHEKNSK